MNRQDVTIKDEPPDESDTDDSSSSFSSFKEDEDVTWWIDDGIELPDLDGKKSSNSISDTSCINEFDDDLPDIISVSETGANCSQLIQDHVDGDIDQGRDSPTHQSEGHVQKRFEEVVDCSSNTTNSDFIERESQEGSIGHYERGNASAGLANRLDEQEEKIQLRCIQEDSEQREIRSTSSTKQDGHSYVRSDDTCTVPHSEGSECQQNERLYTTTAFSNGCDIGSGFADESFRQVDESTVQNGYSRIETLSSPIMPCERESHDFEATRRNSASCVANDITSCSAEPDTVSTNNDGYCWYEVVDRDTYFANSSLLMTNGGGANTTQSAGQDTNEAVSCNTDNIDFSSFIVSTDYIIIQPDSVAEENGRDNLGSYQLDSVVPGRTQLSVTGTNIACSTESSNDGMSTNIEPDMLHNYIQACTTSDNNRTGLRENSSNGLESTQTISSTISGQLQDTATTTTIECQSHNGVAAIQTSATVAIENDNTVDSANDRAITQKSSITVNNRQVTVGDDEAVQETSHSSHHGMSAESCYGDSHHENTETENTGGRCAQLPRSKHSDAASVENPAARMNISSDFCYSDISDAEETPDVNLEDRQSGAVVQTDLTNGELLDNSADNGPNDTSAGNSSGLVFSDISDEEVDEVTEERTQKVNLSVKQSGLDRSNFNLCTSLETQLHFSDISDAESPACNSGAGDANKNQTALSVRKYLEMASSIQRDTYNRNNNASVYRAKRISQKYKTRIKRDMHKSPTKSQKKSSKHTTLEKYYSDITNDSSEAFSDIDRREVSRHSSQSSVCPSHSVKSLIMVSNMGVTNSITGPTSQGRNGYSDGELSASDTSTESHSLNSEPNVHHRTSMYSDISSDSCMSFTDSKRSRNLPRVSRNSDTESSETESDNEEDIPFKMRLRRKSPKRLRSRESWDASELSEKEPDGQRHHMSSFIVSDSESEDMSSSDCDAESEDNGEEINEDINNTEEVLSDDEDHSEVDETNAASKLKDGTADFLVLSSSLASNSVQPNADFVQRAKVVASKCDDADSGISDHSTTKSFELSSHNSHSTISEADGESAKRTQVGIDDSFLHGHHSKACYSNNQTSNMPHVKDSSSKAIVENHAVESMDTSPVTSEKNVIIVDDMHHGSPEEIVIIDASVVRKTSDDTFCKNKLIPSTKPRKTEHLGCKKNQAKNNNEVGSTNCCIKAEIPTKSEIVVSEVQVSNSLERLCSFPTGVIISSLKKVRIASFCPSDAHCKRITLLGSARHIEFLTLESTGDEKDASSDSSVNSKDFSSTESDEPTLDEDTLGSSTLDEGLNTTLKPTDDMSYGCTDNNDENTNCTGIIEGHENYRKLSKSSDKQKTCSKSKSLKRKTPSDLLGQCVKLQQTPVVKVRKLSSSSLNKLTRADNTGTLSDHKASKVRAKGNPQMAEQNAEASSKNKKRQSSVLVDNIQPSKKHRKEDVTHSETTSQKQTIRESLKRGKKQICITCFKSFNSKVELYKHFTRAHQGVNVNKPHRCLVCGRCFKVKYHLTQHISVHTGEKPFECVFCGQGFKRKSQLECHKLIHTGLKLYQCGLCIREFAHHQAYKTHLAIHKDQKKHACKVCKEKVNCIKRHMMTHTAELPYGCDMCEKRFANTRELKIHSVKHSSGRRFKCNQCGDKYKTRACLRLHIKTHSGEAPYKCDICEGTFTHQNYIKIHLRAHTGKRPHTCVDCGQCFSQRVHLKRHAFWHLVTKADHKCKKCGKLFLRKSYLKTHRKIHTEEKQYVCSICGKTFRNNGELKAHSHVDHQGIPAVTQWPCQICDKIATDMSRHLQAHREEKPFQCRLCHVQLADKQTLRNHMFIHTGEKPLQCPECGKYFRFRSVLQLHQMIHTDGSGQNQHQELHINDISEGTYVSKQCGKGFNASTALDTHLKQHSGTKLHTCPLCDKRFVEGTQLKNHLLVHYPFQCNKCDKKFQNNDTLAMHKSRNHPEGKPFSCILCPAKFSSLLSKDKHHRLKHDNPDKNCVGKKVHHHTIYDCQKCSYTTQRKNSLLEHVKTIHEGMEKNLRCPVSGCKTKFRNQGSLNEHLKTTHSEERPVICKVCQKRFKTEGCLKLHMTHSHSDEKSYKCTICDKQFKQKSNLKQHFLTHSDLKSFKGEMRPYSAKRKQSLRHVTEQTHENKEKCLLACDKCDKTFKRHLDYKKHMRKHAERTSCQFCSKTFSRPDSLKVHMRMHTGEKPHLCTHCSESFSRNDLLQDHLRKHTGEMIKCKKCPKLFMTHFALTTHKCMRKHEKRIPCPFCSKTFSHHHSFKIHIRTHTGEKPYLCPHCSKSFSRNDKLKDHLRKHTGEMLKCKKCPKLFKTYYARTGHKCTPLRETGGIVDNEESPH